MLGCSEVDVRRHLGSGRLVAFAGGQGLDGMLDRETVERLASEVYPWRRRADDPDPYWVTGQRAADLLGVSRSRLGQLADARRVPHVRHQDGTRLYRRAELIALRDSRASNGSGPRGAPTNTWVLP
jgi:hypothetical protein